MASYSAVAPAIHKTLTAGTVDTVTFPADFPFVEVENRDTTELYFTADGQTAPSVLGDGCYRVGPGDSLRVDASLKSQPTPNSTVVKLISASAVAYSVTVS